MTDKELAVAGLIADEIPRLNEAVKTCSEQFTFPVPWDAVMIQADRITRWAEALCVLSVPAGEPHLVGVGLWSHLMMCTNELMSSIEKILGQQKEGQDTVVPLKNALRPAVALNRLTSQTCWEAQRGWK